MVKDYLERRNRLRQRFQDEKLGEASLHEETAKLFTSVTTEATRQAKEIEQVAAALERLPPQIAAEADFSLINSLFSDKARKALPAPARLPTLFVNLDQNLDTI